MLLVYVFPLLSFLCIHVTYFAILVYIYIIKQLHICLWNLLPSLVISLGVNKEIAAYVPLLTCFIILLKCNTSFQNDELMIVFFISTCARYIFFQLRFLRVWDITLSRFRKIKHSMWQDPRTFHKCTNVCLFKFV